MRFSAVLSACVALGVVATAPQFCAGDEKQTVTISYVIGPPRPLPEGLKGVAVIDSGVETKGTKQDEREVKWSNMAADMVEAMLQNSSMQFGAELSVAKRRETKHILEERDLRLAGLVEGDAAAEAGKLLAVQGLITSRITISIDVEKATKSTVDWTSVLGGVAQSLGNRGKSPGPPPRQVIVQPAPRPVYRERVVAPAPRARSTDPRYRVAPDPRVQRATPAYRDPRLQRRHLYDPNYAAYRGYQPAPVVVVPGQPAPAPAPAPAFGTREVEEISRHLTVQCSFSLIDAVTGKAIVQYTPPAYQKTDTQSPDFLFGELMDQKELDPVDHFIGELIERATQEFVSLIVPTQVGYTYSVVGKHTASEAGVRALRADDYETALGHFQKELEKRSDEHETMFAMGVTFELMGEPQKAMDWYKRASSAKGVDEEELVIYSAARKRLAEHMPRILKPLPAQEAPGGSPPPAPPGE